MRRFFVQKRSSGKEVDMPVRMMHGPGGRFLTEEENASRPKVTRELLTRIGAHLVPYWKQLFLALLCVTASSILNLYPAILTGRIIDQGLIGQDLPVLVQLIVLSGSDLQRKPDRRSGELAQRLDLPACHL